MDSQGGPCFRICSVVVIPPRQNVKKKTESRNPLKPEKDNQCFFRQGNRNESNEAEENVANKSAVQRAMQRKGKEHPGLTRNILSITEIHFIHN